MPTMQGMVERANVLLNRENIGKIDAGLLAAGASLSAGASGVGIAVSEREVTYLASWPEGQREALRAALHSAVSRSPRLPVTLAWAPGYDYEVRIWEAAGTKESLGAMTIFLRSPYPSS